MSNPIPIMKTLDALSIAAFIDIGKEGAANGDQVTAELYYKRAVRTAETIFGALHGEVGLVLNLLAEFYRRTGKAADAEVIEGRIAEIVALYRHDQQC